MYSCGEATEQSLVYAGVLPAELVDFLGQFEDYERLRESAYQLFSNNRDYLAHVIGREPPVSQHLSDDEIHPGETD